MVEHPAPERSTVRGSPESCFALVQGIGFGGNQFIMFVKVTQNLNNLKFLSPLKGRWFLKHKIQKISRDEQVLKFCCFCECLL
jgi:hypothetical protein